MSDKPFYDFSVLYVEDEDITRKMIATVLRKVVASVEVAKDGRKGLEMCEELRPDVIVTDLEMPVMNGMIMIKKIREFRPDIPVIIISAYNDDEHRVEGVAAHINKPITRQQIYDALSVCAEQLG